MTRCSSAEPRPLGIYMSFPPMSAVWSGQAVILGLIYAAVKFTPERWAGAGDECGFACVEKTPASNLGFDRTKCVEPHQDWRLRSHDYYWRYNQRNAESKTPSYRQ